MGRKAAKNTGGDTGKIVETVTKTREVVAEPDEELDLSDDTEGGDDDDALSKLDEMEPGSGARYEVRRTSPAGFDGYVGTYSREELSPDRIFEEWGGGRFTIRVRNAKGNFLGSAPLAIAGKPKHKGDGIPAAPVVQQQPPPQDSGMKATLEMLTTLVKSLIERPAPVIPPPPPPPDMLAFLAAAKGLFKPERETGGVEMLLKGIDLGKSLAGDGEEPGMASVFLKGFDSLKDLAKIDRAAPPTQPRPSARPRVAAQPAAGTVAAGAPASDLVHRGAPAQSSIEPPPEKPQMTDEQKQLAWIKAQCVALAGQAAKGKDPELYAEVFLDNLPPFAPAALVLETMRDPSALDKLTFLVPAVGTHRAWFEQFLQHVVSFLEEDADDEEDDGTPPMQPPPDIELPGGDGDGDGDAGE